MYKANEQTIEMASFGVEGNVIDHSWYHIIKKKTGKTDCTAIMLLSDIVYWYRPSHQINSETNQHKIYKKFKEDILQRSYADIEKMFGFTKDQARDAFETLEFLGIAERELRTIDINGQKVSNILFIRFNHKKLISLMKCYYEECAELKKSISLSEISDEGIGKNPQAPRKKPMYTETTTKISNDDDCMPASPSVLKIRFLDGREQKMTLQDLFSFAVTARTNWNPEDVRYLFEKLQTYNSQISDLKKLCDKILSNKSKVERAEKYTNQLKETKERYIPEHEKTIPKPQKDLRRWGGEVYEPKK